MNLFDSMDDNFLLYSTLELNFCHQIFIQIFRLEKNGHFMGKCSRLLGFGIASAQLFREHSSVLVQRTKVLHFASAF